MSLNKTQIYKEIVTVHRIMQRYLRGNSTQFRANSEFTKLLDIQVIGSFLFNNSTDYGISIYNNGVVKQFSESGKQIPYYILQIYQEHFMFLESENHEIHRVQKRCASIKEELINTCSINR